MGNYNEKEKKCAKATGLSEKDIANLKISYHHKGATVT